MPFAVVIAGDSVSSVDNRIAGVIGVDAGGTSTRCVVADHGGRRLGAGSAGGLNQHSSGGNPAAVLEEAVRTALGDRSPTTLSGGVLAVAGAGAAGLEKVQRDAQSVWRSLGLPGAPVVVPDVVATFAGSATEPSGQVLVAGTGAIAAAVRHLDVIRQADGYGWWLGDVGSAVWLGREAVAAALGELDARSRPTAVTQPVLDTLDAVTAQDVVRTVYASPPARLGLLARIVTEQALADDCVARDIVNRGVSGLLASLDAVTTASDVPTVLGGALLTRPGPVLDGVREGLHARGITDVRTTADAAMGAVNLALRLFPPSPQHP